MFGIDSSELILVALVALVVIGPKDLPKAMRFVGQWVARARGVMGQFRAGFDSMLREAELKELEVKWAAENERIMREFPAVGTAQMLPTPLIDDPAPAELVVPPALHGQAPSIAPAPTDDEIAAAEGVPMTTQVPTATPPAHTPGIL